MWSGAKVGEEDNGVVVVSSGNDTEEQWLQLRDQAS